ncbi:MAG TPA: DUF1549 domain-containing protein, partial [Verrucomicrobiae bacterium]
GENPVDRILQTYYSSHHLKAGAPVDDRFFARRVYLDVVGLLPTAEDLDRFLADKSKDKRTKLVQHLLADNKRYADNWLSFWNDLLRNDYRGTGYIDGGRKQITKWLYSALATNMPYDQFVAELLNPREENEGFVKGIVWRGVVNASQTPQMQAAQNISQVFLGINLKCASCHDSFINDWTLADAYGLASVYADGPLEMFQCDKPTGKKARVKFLFPELGDIQATSPQAERRKQLARIMSSRENGRLTRTIVNRLWQKFLGHGLVEPVDDMEQLAWSPELLDWLADDLAQHGFDLKHTMQIILTSRAYQLPAVAVDEQTRTDFVFTGPAVRRLSAEQFRDAFGRLSGVWFDTAAAQVEAPVTSAQEKDLLPHSAKWIWSEADADKRALAESVYFQKRFQLDRVPDQASLVAACDNAFTLYLNGAKVTAGKDFTKPGYAEIRSKLRQGENVLAVLGQNFTPDLKAPSEGQPPQDKDANPAGLFVYVRLRAGTNVMDFGTDSTWKFTKRNAAGWEKPEYLAKDWKNSVELGGTGMAPWDLQPALLASLSMALEHNEVRSSLVPADPLMTALGRPNREQVLTVRMSASTTLQALELTNGDTLSKLVKKTADRLLAEKSASSESLINKLFVNGLGRKPTPRELKLANELLGKPVKREGVEDFVWAMAMLPEFQLIY